MSRGHKEILEVCKHDDKRCGDVDDDDDDVVAAAGGCGDGDGLSKTSPTSSSSFPGAAV